MRTVVLVGTDHKFQLPLNGAGDSEAENFRNAIRDLCVRHKVRAIAEEMNPQVVQKYKTRESVPYQVCGELRLLHQYSDPSLQERKALGIRSNYDIELQGWQESWPRKKINAAIRRHGSIASDRIREKEWLRRIRELDAWPLLFICGSDHFVPFATLLRDAGLTVIEAHRDYDPRK